MTTDTNDALARAVAMVVRTVGVPHETLGEVAVTCVVPHADATVDGAQLRAFLRERLAKLQGAAACAVVRRGGHRATGSAKIKSSDLRQLAAKRRAHG
ncbi:hypothetical protein [Nocardia abscessus]|nr:hypothetical protein [Nocardia abscessus]